jgi:lycopene cyclase domain-containing protein
MTYLLIDAVFLLICIGGAAVLLRGRSSGFWRPAAVAGVGLLVLTAVFDNVMIAVGLFSYRADAVSGLSVGRAPIEDFAYPLAAGILLPALWRRLLGASEPEPEGATP